MKGGGDGLERELLRLKEAFRREMAGWHFDPSLRQRVHERLPVVPRPPLHLGLRPRRRWATALALVAVLLLVVGIMGPEGAHHPTAWGGTRYTVDELSLGLGRPGGSGHFLYLLRPCGPGEEAAEVVGIELLGGREPSRPLYAARAVLADVPALELHAEADVITYLYGAWGSPSAAVGYLGQPLLITVVGPEGQRTVVRGYLILVPYAPEGGELPDAVPHRLVEVKAYGAD